VIPLRLTIELDHPGGPVTPLIGELTTAAELAGCPVRGHVGIERLDVTLAPQPYHPQSEAFTRIDGGDAA
jgi:hypothetical protein